MDEPSKRQVLRRGIYLLPNLLTTAALFAGFYAVVAAIDGHFERAAVAIFVAMLFDGLDGRVARMTHTESSFGKEYDSLSDMVSFGLAPAIVAYQWGVARIVEAVSETGQHGVLWSRLGWLATFFFAAAAALRLARFNARSASQDKRYFEGLPSPSAAALVASFIWFAFENELHAVLGLVTAFAVTAVAGALMVSRFPYWSFKQIDWRSPVRFLYFILLIVPFVIIPLDPPVALFTLFGVYSLSGPATWAWRKTRRRPARNLPGPS
ncbi:MAG TPA: phosphatidylcholine/phosphatidylserine synthase [Steroidobacteraceae bacterium]|nr:phosphatidylcholine/phosphatidylserine synthase [Steroidobacteraceae bacterium]